KAGLEPDLFSGELVHGDAVLEARAPRMRSGGQEGTLRVMAAVYVGMGGAGDHGELAAEIAENGQVFRQFVVAPGLRGREIRGEETESEVDGHQAALDRRHGVHISGRQTFQEWQRHGDAAGAQALTPGERVRLSQGIYHGLRTPLSK